MRSYGTNWALTLAFSTLSKPTMRRKNLPTYPHNREERCRCRRTGYDTVMGQLPLCFVVYRHTDIDPGTDWGRYLDLMFDSVS